MPILGLEDTDLHLLFQFVLGTSLWRGRAKHWHHNYVIALLTWLSQRLLFLYFFTSSAIKNKPQQQNPHKRPIQDPRFSTPSQRDMSLFIHSTEPSFLRLLGMLFTCYSRGWWIDGPALLPLSCLLLIAAEERQVSLHLPYSTGLFTVTVWHNLDWIKLLCNHTSNWLTPLHTPTPFAMACSWQYTELHQAER